MTHRFSRCLARVCGLCLIALPMIAFADPGEMMHVSVSGKVQVSNPPMSMAIPQINKDVCTPKQLDVRSIVNDTSRHKNCSYTNYKQDGSTVSFHYSCNDDKQQLDGDGSFTIEAGGMHGTIHANSSMHGMSTIVDMTYQGTHTGTSCEYTAPKPAP